jgi:hypothetical protein
MSTRRDHLARIKDDLEEYVKDHCPCATDGKFTDFSGEQCNDAFLLLQDAMNNLDNES